MASARRRTWTWEDLAELISKKVPKGKVTTYGDLAKLLYGDNKLGPRAIASLLKSWEEHEPETNLTHRVVTDLGHVPAKVRRNKVKLEEEGVRFMTVVDVHRCKVDPTKFDLAKLKP